MSDFEISEQCSDVIKKVKSAENVAEFYPEGWKYERYAALRRPSKPLSVEEFPNKRSRRSSIPLSHNNFNVSVHHRRRYSEVVLSPTQLCRREHLNKVSRKNWANVPSKFNDVFGNFGKKFRSKNQITQHQKTDFSLDGSTPAERGNEIERNEIEEASNRFCNLPRADDFQESNDFVKIDDKNDYMKLEDVEADENERVRETIFMTNESGRSPARTRNKQQDEATTELISAKFGSPISPCDEDFEEYLPNKQRHNSSPFLVRKSLAFSREVQTPTALSDAYNR